MATIHFCERCESLGSETAMGGVRYYTAPTVGLTSVSLCPGCVSEFMEWLHTAPTTDRPRGAYREPWTPTPTADPNAMTAADLFRMAVDKSRRELES